MGLLTLDKSKYQAYKGQQLLDIDKNEFDILWVLSSHPDRIFSEDDIALELEQESCYFKKFSIFKCINSLQRKLSKLNIRLMVKNGFKIEFRKAFKS